VNIISASAPITFSPGDFTYNVQTTQSTIDISIVGSANYACNLLVGTFSQNHSSCQSIETTVTAPTTVVITLNVAGDPTTSQYTITFSLPASSSSSSSNIGIIAGAAGGGAVLLIVVIVLVVLYVKKARKTGSTNIQQFDDSDPLVDETL
jgi:hypothetical protein